MSGFESLLRYLITKPITAPSRTTDYASTKLALANAIVIDRRAGMTDEEIAHVKGLSVPGFRAVLRTRYRDAG